MAIVAIAQVISEFGNRLVFVKTREEDAESQEAIVREQCNIEQHLHFSS